MGLGLTATRKGSKKNIKKVSKNGVGGSMSDCEHKNQEEILYGDVPLVVCHDCETTLGRKTEVYSRCCGYLRPTSQWNKDKQTEFGVRKTYKIEEDK